MIRPTDQETIPIEKAVYTIPKRRKYTMLEGAPHGNSGLVPRWKEREEVWVRNLIVIFVGRMGKAE